MIIICLSVLETLVVLEPHPPAMSVSELSLFFAGVTLESEQKQQALEILDREGVTFDQLKSDITDEDLQELGFTAESRNAILERARNLSSATVSAG